MRREDAKGEERHFYYQSHRSGHGDRSSAGTTCITGYGKEAPKGGGDERNKHRQEITN